MDTRRRRALLLRPVISSCGVGGDVTHLGEMQCVFERRRAYENGNKGSVLVLYACTVFVCRGCHPVTGCYILSAVVMVPSWLLPTGAKQPVPLN